MLAEWLSANICRMLTMYSALYTDEGTVGKG